MTDLAASPSSPSAPVDLSAVARSWETAGGVRPLPSPAHLRSTAHHQPTDLNDDVAYAIVCVSCGYPEDGERPSSAPDPEKCAQCRHVPTPAWVPAQ